MVFRVPAHQVSDKQKKLMRDILLENIICFETMDNIKYRMKRLFFDLENYKKSKKTNGKYGMRNCYYFVLTYVCGL
jgi:hypothetical protein